MELAAEVECQAHDVADRVTRALEEVVDAFGERERVAAHATTLFSTVEVPRPGAVPAADVEAVVREAERVLYEGGEVPPIPRRRVVEQAEPAPA